MTARAARILVVCLLALGFPAAWPAPATADAPIEYGWWYKLNSRTTVLPPPLDEVPRTPPSVPEDGVYVAEDVDPDGPLAIAAFLFLSEDGPGAVFELQISSGAVPEGASIVACPTTGSFASESGGLWENRPQGDCDSLAVPGEVLGTNESMIWKLVADYQVFPEYWSFVLEPGPGSAPFQVAFEAPDGGSFSVDSGEGNFPEEPPPPPFEPDGDFGDPDDAFVFDDFNAGGFVSTPPPFVEEEPTEVPAERAEAQPPVPVQDTSIPATDDTATRAVAVFLLAAMAAGMWALSRQQRRPAVAGAPVDDDVAVVEDTGAEVGGLGRFARPRSRPPRRLM